MSNKVAKLSLSKTNNIYKAICLMLTLSPPEGVIEEQIKCLVIGELKAMYNQGYFDGLQKARSFMGRGE